MPLLDIILTILAAMGAISVGAWGAMSVNYFTHRNDPTVAGTINDHLKNHVTQLDEDNKKLTGEVSELRGQLDEQSNMIINTLLDKP